MTILADRGFGDHKLFAYLADLGFAYVIRFRGNIHVTDACGETRTAANWVGRSGRARKLRGARVTASHAYRVGAVVCVHARDMKEPWCLAASDAETPAGTLIKQYARRWTIDIDQAWRLSRIKGWVGSTCNEAFWVEHCGFQSRPNPRGRSASDSWSTRPRSSSTVSRRSASALSARLAGKLSRHS